uniref:Uncharacterized protein n=1 Tax=Caenorhabditis japonica TaxID=281687 RepID=A0A8R1HUD9_CAEJA
MTYAESTRSVVVYSSIVPPPRTPVGPSMLKDGGIRKGAAPLQPKNGANSLDYWSKAEDEKSGITCYYSRHNMQFPSPRQNNRMKQQPGRPQTSSGQMNGSRYPPFPQSSQPENVMSPPVGIYRNVPAMPRAKLAKEEQKKSVVWGGGGNKNRREQEDVTTAAATSAITPLNPYSANGRKMKGKNMI